MTDQLHNVIMLPKHDPDNTTVLNILQSLFPDSHFVVVRAIPQEKGTMLNSFSTLGVVDAISILEGALSMTKAGLQ